MAAGWARKIGGDRVEVFSGGSEPAEQVNKAAVAAMAEVGIDIGTEVPRQWSERELHAADVVVTMGCGDTCPVYPAKRYVDWELDDPSGKSLDEVRAVRDEIEKRVRALMAELLAEPRPSRHAAETEKNLNRTFDEAKKTEAELSFEESDELFD